MASTFFRVRTSVLARSFDSRANLVLKVRNTHFGDGNLTRDCARFVRYSMRILKKHEERIRCTTTLRSSFRASFR